MPKKRVRAAGYPRSSDPNLADSPTLESQAKAIREHCKKEDYDLTEDHMYPEAMSAYMLHYTQRPQLMKLLQAAKRREFDVLVVTEVRALSRKQVEVFVIYDLLQKCGVRIETLQEKFEDSAIGRFILASRAMNAELERENTHMRTMRGRQDRIDNGYLRGHGKPCYAYAFLNVGKEVKAHYELNGKVIYVDAAGQAWTEVKVVIYIFELFLQGESLRGICVILNELGLPTPGKPRKGVAHWQAATVYKILTTREYIGEALVNKWKRDGKRLVRQSDENVTHLPEGVCPAIISKEDFEMAQRRLAYNKLDSPRNNRHHPQDLGILRWGFCKCGICGRTMNVKHHNPTPTNDRRKPEYCCQRKSGKGDLLCNHLTVITTSVADGAAWKKAVEVICDPSLVRARVEQLRAENGPQIDTEGIESTLESIRRQMNNLFNLAKSATDDETIDTLTAMLKELEKRKREAGALLYDLEEDDEERALVEEELAKFEGWAEKVRPLLGNPDYRPTYEEQRLAVRILGLRATVFPASGGYPFRCRISVDPPAVVSRLGRGCVASDQS